MYVPAPNAVEHESEVRAMVSSVGSGELVTTGPDGYPVATLLPVLWDGGTVVAHMARANDHWRSITEPTKALLLVAGPQAYVSPGWYASKAEHGRVVPTWNYESVHLSGTVRVHDDADWVRAAVTRLTERHEHARPEPWAVTDAPERYTSGMLRAIVGVELIVERVEAKRKLSQNRSDADRAGVVAGLDAEADPGASAIADAMRR